MFDRVVDFIREVYATSDFIPLHEPRFWGREKDYIAQTIDSTFVSSVGKYVDDFESAVAAFTGARYAVATVNGTAALHAALILSGVEAGDEVLTQPLTFVATCNAISYLGAKPVFIDVERQTLGLSPESLENFLADNADRREGGSFNKTTGRRIAACVPMHVFGHPARIVEIVRICREYSISIIEDAAESLGSLVGRKHTGLFGELGVLSFNGNKIITTGGGGMLITDDENLAARAKHITTTAKVAHPWHYRHDTVGFNYRMPNLNAALGCAQMEQLPAFITDKRALADIYRAFFAEIGVEFVDEPPGTRSNFWLNAICMESMDGRDRFLDLTNSRGIMTRPAWVPMHRLSMFENCGRADLSTAEWLTDRLVNVPSSVRKSSNVFND